MLFGLSYDSLVIPAIGCVVEWHIAQRTQIDPSLAALAVPKGILEIANRTSNAERETIEKPAHFTQSLGCLAKPSGLVRFCFVRFALRAST